MLYFTTQKQSPPRSDPKGLRSGGWRFYFRIMLGSCSDYPRIVFLLAEALQGLCAEILSFKFCCGRSIWWGWRVTLLAPHNGNDVSYVMRLKDAIHFAWQAQYLLSLKSDFTCSAHWKWRFICDADHWMTLVFCGRRSISWGWRVTFRGRRTTSWHFGR